MVECSVRIESCDKILKENQSDEPALQVLLWKNKNKYFNGNIGWLNQFLKTITNETWWQVGRL